MFINYSSSFLFSFLLRAKRFCWSSFRALDKYRIFLEKYLKMFIFTIELRFSVIAVRCMCIARLHSCLLVFWSIIAFKCLTISCWRKKFYIYFNFVSFLRLYRAHMKLTIRNLQYGDFGNYRCISKNSLGETEGSIRVYGKQHVLVYLFIASSISREFYSI